MRKRSPILVLLVAVTAGLVAASGAPAAAATQQAKITAIDSSPFDQFGIPVLDGDTALVGVQLDDDRGSDSGSVYVYGRDGAGWTLDAKLRASDGDSSDRFGNSVALDGDTAVVGAFLEDDKGFDAGAAYVFVRSGGVWTQQAKLRASDGASSDWFGFSVAVSGDTVVVGSRLDDPKGTDSGSAYVFTRTGTQWTEQAKIVPADGAGSDHFGYRVEVQGDTALVTALQDDDKGPDSGSAYIFERSAGVWTQQAKLVASPGAAFDNFGISSAFEGDRVLIGAYLDDDFGTDSGAAFMFSRTAGIWTQEARLHASGAAQGDQFGVSVSLSGDRAVIGARFDDTAGINSNGGSARLFVRDASGEWAEDSVLVPADVAPNDLFGHPVSVDGPYAFAAALGDDDGGTDSGSVYVFSTTIPVVADDAYAVDEDGTLVVPAPGVLGNDTDPEGQSLRASLETPPSNGALALNPDGGFIYVPGADFNGTDSFTYTATDPTGAASTGAVTITVAPVNDAPVAADDEAATPQYEPVVIDVLANDTDVDGDALSVESATDGASGAVSINGDGTLTYTPGPAFRGSDSFTYTVTDGAATDMATVVVLELGCANGEVEDGPVSSVVDGAEPLLGSADAAVAKAAHDANCTVVAPQGL